MRKGYFYLIKHNWDLRFAVCLLVIVLASKGYL